MRTLIKTNFVMNVEFLLRSPPSRLTGLKKLPDTIILKLTSLLTLNQLRDHWALEVEPLEYSIFEEVLHRFYVQYESSC